MYHIRNHHVETIENRQDKYHSEGRNTNTYNRNPGDDVNKIVTFLRKKITLRYE